MGVLVLLAIYTSVMSLARRLVCMLVGTQKTLQVPRGTRIFLTLDGELVDIDWADGFFGAVDAGPTH